MKIQISSKATNQVTEMYSGLIKGVAELQRLVKYTYARKTDCYTVSVFKGWPFPMVVRYEGFYCSRYTVKDELISLMCSSLLVLN